MKNTYIGIIVLIVVIGGAALILGSGKKAEAPNGNTGNTTVPKDNSQDGGQVACTMEAKQCPDGSYVGRSGPKCEFKACPTVSIDTTTSPIKEFTVTGNNFSFTPSVMTVKKGDKVKITFKNANGFHDFKLDEFDVATQRIQAGGEEKVEFLAYKTGTFEYYCSVGDHRAKGMRGTLKVE